jgi:hypothetical protein
VGARSYAHLVDHVFIVLECCVVEFDPYTVCDAPTIAAVDCILPTCEPTCERGGYSSVAPGSVPPESPHGAIETYPYKGVIRPRHARQEYSIGRTWHSGTFCSELLASLLTLFFLDFSTHFNNLRCVHIPSLTLLCRHVHQLLCISLIYFLKIYNPYLLAPAALSLPQCF